MTRHTWQIATSELPAADREDAFHVQQLLSGLDSFADRFRSALLLKNHADAEIMTIFEHRAEQRERDPDSVPQIGGAVQSKLHLMSHWGTIAERDAIITVWDFSTTCYNIRSGLDRCPSLNAMVDRRDLERALKRVSEAFPDRKKARHAAAHMADFQKSAKEIARHSLRGPRNDWLLHAEEGGSLFLGHGSMDGTVMYTSDGNLVAMEVTEASLQILVAIADEMWACFRGAIRETHRRMAIRFGLPDLPEEFDSNLR